MRLLILENEPSVATLLSMLVEGCGHCIEAIAVDAREAVDAARRFRPDLVLADIDLGSESDGIEAAVEIRQTMGIRTVFVTGNADRETRDRAQYAWPAAFITKPFDPEAFGKILSGVAGVQQSACSHWPGWLA